MSQLNDLVVSYVTTTKDSLTEIKKATTTLTAPNTAPSAPLAKPTNQLSTTKRTVKPDHRDEARKVLDQAAKLK